MSRVECDKARCSGCLACIVPAWTNIMMRLTDTQFQREYMRCKKAGIVISKYM